MVDREVSLAADEAYSDEGTALYDSVVLTEKDKETVAGYIEDALNAFITRTRDICRKVVDDDEESLEFFVPDIDAASEPLVKEEISKYVTAYTAAEIFQTRRPALVPAYTERTKYAMDRAVTLLKTRKNPDEIWR